MKIVHNPPHGPLRKTAYMDVGDQLDALMKALAHPSSQGISLPAETVEWIEHCKQVKEKYKRHDS